MFTAAFKYCLQLLFQGQNTENVCHATVLLLELNSSNSPTNQHFQIGLKHLSCLIESRNCVKKKKSILRNRYQPICSNSLKTLWETPVRRLPVHPLFIATGSQDKEVFYILPQDYFIIMLITKKNKKQGLQFDFRGSPSSAICEHILQSLSYNKIKKILLIRAM